MLQVMGGGCDANASFKGWSGVSYFDNYPIYVFSGFFVLNCFKIFRNIEIYKNWYQYINTYIYMSILICIFDSFN